MIIFVYDKFGCVQFSALIIYANWLIFLAVIASSLEDRKARKEWEETVDQTYIQPIMKVFSIVIVLRITTYIIISVDWFHLETRREC